MLRISLSFSGKEHEGARLPTQENEEDLIRYTPDDFIHDEKKSSDKPKRDLAIPHQDSEDGETRQVYVKKEIWLGRRERDPAPRKPRTMRKHGKKLGGLT